jgi:hypothetical protein
VDETTLLLNYHSIAVMRGRLYTEVPLGGAQYGWPSACGLRRLDGIRILTDEGIQEVTPFALNKTTFFDDISRWPIELIEVKDSLNRSVIGQVIAGKHMFIRQYQVIPARLVVVCRRGDACLEWVCQQEGIIVERIGFGSAKGSAPI